MRSSERPELNQLTF